MARTKRKSEWAIGEQPAIATPERTLPEPSPSPARALQQLLEDRTAIRSDEEVRWSRRRSLAMIVAASSALWMALLAVAHGVVALAA